MGRPGGWPAHHPVNSKHAARRTPAIRTGAVRLRPHRYLQEPLGPQCPSDELPRIFEAAPGLLALTCFSGEGNVLAPLLGRHLAEALVKDDLGELALPVQAPSVPRWRGRYDFTLRKVGVPALVAAERLGLY